MGGIFNHCFEIVVITDIPGMKVDKEKEVRLKITVLIMQAY